jgi:hypothetical protein
MEFEKEAVMEKAIKEARADGLAIFIDGDKELDYIRRHAPQEIVIQAVAIRRAQQIARNYAQRYAPELLSRFKITTLSEKTFKCRGTKKFLKGDKK